MGRRLRTAASKKYLCLLPMNAQVGDQLCIMKGGRVRVVLRPWEDGYVQFVGEADVHGIMDGERPLRKRTVQRLGSCSETP